MLAGLALRHGHQLEQAVTAVSARTRAALAALDASANAVAEPPASRVTVLTPPALFGAGREASLKILEMTDGAVVSMPETFVGVRHGPMTFLRENELVLCLLSSDMHLRRYEEDLLFELRAKKLGRILAVASAPSRSLADHVVARECARPAGHPQDPVRDRVSAARRLSPEFEAGIESGRRHAARCHQPRRSGNAGAAE